MQQSGTGAGGLAVPRPQTVRAAIGACLPFLFGAAAATAACLIGLAAVGLAGWTAAAVGLVGAGAVVWLAVRIRQAADALGPVAEALDNAELRARALASSSALSMVTDDQFRIRYVVPALAESLARSARYWANQPTPVDAHRLEGLSIDFFHRDSGRIRAMLSQLQEPLVTGIGFDGRRFQLRIRPMFGPGGAREGFLVEWTETTGLMRDDAAERAGAQAAAVAAVGAALEKLAGGDLTHRVDADFPTGYEKLRDDLNAVFAGLEAPLAQVHGSAMAIRAATTDIAAASDDLARRTESQAASLEQTAAAIEQITATTRNTADNASRARAVVTRARGEAETGGTVVQQAVAAMGNIQKSSERIGQIIGLIDEIAFQTNLLALNAGVEAARAGEAGRGFAVVASEVRALAQRSADSAQEIKTLILSSKQEVQKGAELVSGTGEALGRIIAGVAEIDDVVSDIATSAAEQATGLQEINGAVSQMDQITQQNAAMVERATVSVKALSQQTGAFAGLLGHFRTRKPAKPGPVVPAETTPAAPPSRALSRGAAARPGTVAARPPAALPTSVKPARAAAARTDRPAAPAAVARAVAANPAARRAGATVRPPQPAEPVKTPKPVESKPVELKSVTPKAARRMNVGAGTRAAGRAAPAARKPAEAPVRPRRAPALARVDSGGWEEF